MTGIQKLAKSDYLKLVPVLALAFYMAFIPHLNYPYPVHLDEWQSLTYFQAVLGSGNITFPDPWSGGAASQYPNPEIGFHVLWAVFQQISNMPWLNIFRYFPSVTFMITVLSVYALAHREGFGWEAALFTCLIPTTVGILGPAFMVPVAMGLLFIALSLLLAFNFRSWWSYMLLFLFTTFLVSMHVVTAIVLAIILAPYILLTVKRDFKHSLGITLAIAAPLLVAAPWLFSTIVLPAAKSLLIPQYPLPYVDLSWIVTTYGYLPTLISPLGVFVLAMRGETRNYGLVLGLLSLIAMLTIFFTFHYGITLLYYRGLVYAMLMLSIMAGAGLMGVNNIRLPTQAHRLLRVPLLTRNGGKIACLLLVGLTLLMVIPVRNDASYYHMIDEEDYMAFIWIKENVDNSYDKAILDPWKATAFTAITGKKIYSRIGEYPTAADNKAYAFLGNNCTDTDFMKSNGISMVYTKGGCDNPSLVQVREHVYLLTEPRPQSAK